MFKLKLLPYAFDALEPHIDAKTMELHHNKHHQTYTDNFNKVLANYPILKNKSAEDILKELNHLPVSESDREKIKNHGGGYVNHNIFWDTINPNNAKNKKLSKEIIETFGSIEEFKKKFSEVASTQFGSGWAWLVKNNDGKLEVYSLPNQNSPYTLGHEPIFNLDVWEHAYYLKFQNRRADYIEMFWQILKII